MISVRITVPRGISRDFTRGNVSCWPITANIGKTYHIKRIYVYLRHRNEVKNPERKWHSVIILGIREKPCLQNKLPNTALHTPVYLYHTVCFMICGRMDDPIIVLCLTARHLSMQFIKTSALLFCFVIIFWNTKKRTDLSDGFHIPLATELIARISVPIVRHKQIAIGVGEYAYGYRAICSSNWQRRVILSSRMKSTRTLLNILNFRCPRVMMKSYLDFGNTYAVRYRE